MPAKSTPKPTRPDTVRKGHKWCPRCGQVKKHAEFAKNKASTDGLFRICKACESDWRRERKAALAAGAAPVIRKGSPGYVAPKPVQPPKATRRRSRKPTA